MSPAEPTRPPIWPFKSYPGKAVETLPFSEPPPPKFNPAEEDEALL